MNHREKAEAYLDAINSSSHGIVREEWITAALVHTVMALEAQLARLNEHLAETAKR